jgi:hypothetical protein
MLKYNIKYNNLGGADESKTETVEEVSDDLDEYEKNDIEINDLLNTEATYFIDDKILTEKISMYSDSYDTLKEKMNSNIDYDSYDIYKYNEKYLKWQIDKFYNNLYEYEDFFNDKIVDLINNKIVMDDDIYLYDFKNNKVIGEIIEFVKNTIVYYAYIDNPDISKEEWKVLSNNQKKKQTFKSIRRLKQTDKNLIITNQLVWEKKTIENFNKYDNIFIIYDLNKDNEIYYEQKDTKKIVKDNIILMYKKDTIHKCNKKSGIPGTALIYEIILHNGNKINTKDYRMVYNIGFLKFYYYGNFDQFDSYAPTDTNNLFIHEIINNNELKEIGEIVNLETKNENGEDKIEFVVKTLHPNKLSHNEKIDYKFLNYFDLGKKYIISIKNNHYNSFLDNELDILYTYFNTNRYLIHSDDNNSITLYTVLGLNGDFMKIKNTTKNIRKYISLTNLLIGNIYQRNVSCILNCIYKKLEDNKSHDLYSTYIHEINNILQSEFKESIHDSFHSDLGLIFTKKLKFMKILSDSKTNFIFLKDLLVFIFSDTTNLYYISYYINIIIKDNKWNNKLLSFLFRLINKIYLDEKKNTEKSYKIVKNLFKLNLTILNNYLDETQFNFINYNYCKKYLYIYIKFLSYFKNKNINILEKNKDSELTIIITETIKLLFEKTSDNNIDYYNEHNIDDYMSILPHIHKKINLILFFSNYYNSQIWYKLFFEIMEIFFDNLKNNVDFRDDDVKMKLFESFRRYFIGIDHYIQVLIDKSGRMQDRHDKPIWTQFYDESRKRIVNSFNNTTFEKSSHFNFTDVTHSLLLSTDYQKHKKDIFNILFKKFNTLVNEPEYLLNTIYTEETFHLYKLFDENFDSLCNNIQNHIYLYSEEMAEGNINKHQTFIENFKEIKSIILDLLIYQFNQMIDFYKPNKVILLSLFRNIIRNISNSNNLSISISGSFFNKILLISKEFSIENDQIEFDQLNSIINIIKYNLKNDLKIYDDIKIFNFSNIIINTVDEKYINIAEDVFQDILLSIYKEKNKEGKSLGSNIKMKLQNTEMNIDIYNESASLIYLDSIYSYNYYKFIKKYPKNNEQMNYRIQIEFDENLYFNSVVHYLSNQNVRKSLIDYGNKIKFKSIHEESIGEDAGGVCRSVFTNIFKDIIKKNSYEKEVTVYGMIHKITIIRDKYFTPKTDAIFYDFNDDLIVNNNESWYNESTYSIMKDIIIASIIKKIILPINFHPNILLLIKYDYNYIFHSIENFLSCFNELKEYDELFLNNILFKVKEPYSKLLIIKFFIEIIYNKDFLFDDEVFKNIQDNIKMKKVFFDEDFADEYKKLNDNLKTYNNKKTKFDNIISFLQERESIVKIRNNKDHQLNFFKDLYGILFDDIKMISFSQEKDYINSNYYNLLKTFSLRDIKFLINGQDKIDFNKFKEEIMKNSEDSIKELANRNKLLPNNNDTLTEEIILEKLNILWNFIENQIKDNSDYLRTFLEYMTGSNALPMQGYDGYTYKIKFELYYDKNNSKKAPVSHTCSNTLEIYLRTFFDDENSTKIWEKLYSYDILKEQNKGTMGVYGGGFID